MYKKAIKTVLFSIFVLNITYAVPTSVIRINQMGYEINGPKMAVIQYSNSTTKPTTFEIQNLQGTQVFSGNVINSKADSVPSWGGRYFWTIDFSDFKTKGTYKIKVNNDTSFRFDIGENIIFTKTIGELLYCYTQMRNTLEADKTLLLYGSTNRVNIYGGYNEASGDKSKHICHLQYSNYLCGAENPALTWWILRDYDMNSTFCDSLGLKTKIFEEAAWGADYLMRSLSPDGYFYSTVFNQWDETKERVVCAYKAGLSGTDVVIQEITANYQTAFREGGGVAIAALAKASSMNVTSTDNTPAKYLEGAKKAYDHIKANNTKYCDDGKENIGDDYEALVAAVELYKATKEEIYKTDAAARADRLLAKVTADGWFAADDDKNRPYYHANEEGMPIIALAYYLEIDKSKEVAIKEAFSKNIAWYFKITRDIINPFNYVRVYAKPFKNGALQAAASSYFIPKYNETNYWWQGENARLGSMATAIFSAAKVLNANFTLGKDSLSQLAFSQIDWILGKNPFEVCMIHKSGTVNPPDYIPEPNTPPTSIRGGICNGITSYKLLQAAYEGIDFAPYLPSDTDNYWKNWRWLEQWLPHEFWYMNAISVLSQIIRNTNTGISSGYQNYTMQPSLTIAKNPGAGIVTISINGVINKNAMLSIFDSKGRIISRLHLQKESKRFILHTRNLSAGIFFAEVKNGTNSSVRKKMFIVH